MLCMLRLRLTDCRRRTRRRFLLLKFSAYWTMADALSDEKNVLGGPLQACSFAPLTGFFRDGCCATRGEPGVAHLVCVKVTEEFLTFSRERGNDLITPR